MAQPARAASLLGAAAVLTLMGPFNTGEAMRALPRFGYWLVLVGLSYSGGYAANMLAERLVPSGMIKRIAIAGPLTGVMVLALVYLLNGFAIGYWATGRDLAVLAANVIGIAVIVSAVFQIAYQTNDATPQTTPLLDRLPFDKRGALVSLTVEDHYVRIRTTKGEEMILLRLADAIREVGATNGLQVHRSHWAALDQITKATRKGDGAILTMAHGPDIPVSRANVAKLKEAGLLPRT